ncbi:peroxide stress protein YaaA [Novispirillum itersonii]|uniref:peroxide stress protein YaaA n=1 Tax=Novispirillum itersonii TaxID=189 RepID=UPI0003823092|nr:peroxide stress protein YaaA [Novispirillum itersonii]
MLAVLSPAKNLDFTAADPALPHTLPDLAADTAELAGRTRSLTPADLRRLMDISDKLADLNHARFQVLGSAESRASAKQAALAFAGDTYIGLRAGEMSADDLGWAQNHLRILSGLYGALRPLDLMEPYRLEMGTKLDNPRGKDLYAFWKGRISAVLNAAVDGHAHPVIINLASSEYYKAADDGLLTRRVITPVFHEERDGKARVIGLMAKRARGMMARHIILNRLEDPEQLKDFSDGGYAFRPAESGDSVWVFARPQP